MSTVHLQQLEIARPEQPVRDLADTRQSLMEEACLTGLSVLGILVLLLTLLMAAKLVYFALTIQNGMFILPSSGAF